MAIMIITSILSLRGLPSEAKYGVQSIFYYLFAAAAFLLPFSLLCAELASTYTKSGGLYRWVAEAFGPRWGWLAMFLEWQTIVIWFPTVLMFAAASLAYIFWPDSFDAALASNKTYTLVIAMVVYWGATAIAFKGQRKANVLTTYGGMVGTIIPGAVLSILENPMDGLQKDGPKVCLTYRLNRNLRHIFCVASLNLKSQWSTSLLLKIPALRNGMV